MTKEHRFSKYEDEYTRAGWRRVDKGLPGVGQRIEVMGYFDGDEEKVLDRDTAKLAKYNNAYYFETTEYIWFSFIVLYWR